MLKRLLVLTAVAVLSTASVYAATYDISAVGTIAVTSITGSGAASSTVYNDGTGPVTTTPSTGVGINMNFSGTITDLTSLQPGDVIQIPITIAAGSHFPSLGLAFNSILGSYFTVSTNGNTILLTANSNISSAVGAYTFNLQGTTTLFASGSLANSMGTTTTYTVNGVSYTTNNDPLVLPPATTCIASSTATPNMSSSLGGIYYALGCIYNQLLHGTLSLTSSDLTSNLVEVITIPASSEVVSVTWGSASPTNFMDFVMPDNSSVSGYTAGGFTSSASFTTVSIPANATMTQIQAAMQPGQRAIVQNSDGSYTIAVDWGNLINNLYLEYPAGVSLASMDPNADALMQTAIADKLSAYMNRLDFNVNFADSTIQNSVPGSVTTNLSSLFSNLDAVFTNTPINNSAVGQTTIKVHYVTPNGAALQTIDVSYGYPAGNALGVATTNPVQAAPANIPGYTLVTSSAVLDTITSFSTSGILTGNSSVAYPSTGTTDVYYVYVPILLPVTLVAFTAAKQGNAALLQWTTATEINNKGFNIQRSTDVQSWSSIGFVNSKAANGNSSSRLNYSFTDNTPASGINYYRIQQTDLNGNTAFSAVKSLDFGVKATIYPNPVSSQLNVSVAANSSYQLIDIPGRTVLTGNLQAGKNLIDVSSIPAGTYLLLVTSGGSASVYKVVKK